MAEIILENVTKKYSDGTSAVENFSLKINDGEFVILVGPSGCGKSTTLNMIAGLEDISSGDLLIAGERVNNKAPKDRDIAMVFQSYALYPHMTVRQNIAFPLTLAKLPAAEVSAKVAEAAAILDLESVLDKKPAFLSGGQRQRVAMGRAIVRSPKAFLMDEPLSNLDAKLRVQMRTEISRIQRRLGTTMVYVTHDQTEAMTLGDRVVVMRGGAIQQVGTPSELYNAPANLFVAGFIGSPAMNFVSGILTRDTVQTPLGEFPLANQDEVIDRARAVSNTGEVIVGVRPEHFEDAELIDRLTRTVGGTLPITVDLVEALGSDNFVHFSLKNAVGVDNSLSELSEEIGVNLGSDDLVARVSPESTIARGATAELYFDKSKVLIFDRATGTNLSV